MTQCMSLYAHDQGFSKQCWGVGEWEILLREFHLYGSENLRRSDFDRLNFFEANNNILLILNVD